MPSFIRPETMPISWYPGHMHKARRELAQTLRECDLLLEILDARAPAASANPLLAEMRGNLPCLRILNKSDLADPAVTTNWQAWYRRQPGSDCLINGLDSKLKTGELLGAARRLLKNSNHETRQMLIYGIPNTGKSTLLNQILDRKLAKTGNEPAVTRHQQRVKLDDQWTLIDTPGLLWPRLTDQTAAYRLAFIGSIRNTALDVQDVGEMLAQTLLKEFPDQLLQRYRFDSLPTDAGLLLESLGRQRGCLGRRGQVDHYKAAELLLNEFRSGKIGALSLEQPVESARQPSTSEQGHEVT